MGERRRLTGWAVLAAAMVVTGVLVVVASHRDKGWSETGTIIYEFGFVVVLGALPIIIGFLASRRPERNRSDVGQGSRGVGRWHIASAAMAAGGAGMLIGRSLSEFNPPGPVWTSTAAFPLALIVIGLATWNFLEPRTERLVAIGLLAAGGLLFTVFDVGAAPPVWDREYAGAASFGIWLFCLSGVVVLLAALGSYLTEIPGRSAPNAAGIIGDEGQSPPAGWWIASNGRWYPPELHEDAAPSPGSDHVPRYWRRQRWLLVAGVVVALWAIGFVVSNVERLRAAQDHEEDRGPREPDAWTIDPDGTGDGVPFIHMIKTFSPLEESDVDDVGGRLVWAEIEIELCRVEIRAADDGFVQVGDIFAVSEGCDDDSQLRDAFDAFGMPEAACVFARSGGVDHRHCAPLAVEQAGELDR